MPKTKVREPLDLETASEQVDRLLDEANVFIAEIAVADATALQRSRRLARDSGERLTRAKAICPHGEWKPRLKAKGIPMRTASQHMKYFEQTKSATVADLPSVRNKKPSSGKSNVRAAKPPRDEAERMKRKKWAESQQKYWAKRQAELDHLRKMFEAEEVEKRKEARKEEQEARKHEKLMQSAKRAEIEAGVAAVPALGTDNPQGMLELALEIITAGYHALSRKAHPDVGGNASEQSALSRVRDWLVAIVKNPIIKTLINRR